jgi:DNA polymerase-1
MPTEAGEPCPPGTLVVLDGNWFAHRFHHGRPQQFGTDGRPVGMLYAFAELFAQLRDNSTISHWALALDHSSPSFRHELFPDYKAHRPPTPPELKEQLALLPDLADAFRMPVLRIAGYEADDVLGTLARRGDEHGLSVRLATRDKDLDQVLSERVSTWDPLGGRLRGPAELLSERGIRPDQVADWLAMVGDSADNITGIRGVGPKGAQQLLERFGDLDGLLDQRQELTGKRKEHVHAFVERKELVCRLVRIDCQVPAVPALDALTKPVEFDVESLRSTLDHIGIRAARFLPAQRWPQPPALTHEDRLPALIAEIAQAERCALAWQDGTLGLAWRQGPGQRVQLSAAGFAKLFRRLHESDVELVALDGPYTAARLAEDLAIPLPQLHCCTSAAAAIDPEQAWHDRLLIERFGDQPSAAPTSADGLAVAARVVDRQLRELLLRRRLAHSYQTRDVPSFPGLAHMLRHGLAVDRALIAERGEHFQDLARQLHSEVCDLTGTQVDLSDQRQVEALLEQQDSIPHSPGLDELESLRSHNQLVDLLFQERQARLLSTRIADGFPALGIDASGRCRPRWCRHMRRPRTPLLDLTNQRLGRSLGRAVLADPGRAFSSARLVDPTLSLLARATGADILVDLSTVQPWRSLCARITDASINAIGLDQAEQCRHITYAMLDGISPRALARRMAWPTESAIATHAHYQERLTDILTWWQNQLDEVADSGVITGLSGRQRALTGLVSSNASQAVAARKRARQRCFDTATGDILLMAMAKAHARKQPDAHLYFYSDDGLLIDGPDTSAEDNRALLQDCLREAVQNACSPASHHSFSFKTGIGTTWADAA